jgi:hypothetical protein
MTEIHPMSFQLGMINCFAEMVAVGVKRLAISPPLHPEEYRQIREASETIVAGSGIRSYLEKSLIVTDLQSSDFTRGRWSILFFREEETLEAYLALKKEKEALEARNAYTSEAGRRISTEFMRLLSYPEETIEEKVSGGGRTDPFILNQS